ncbi:uncharacterized protein JN550_008322 [Neoarthrinium moseri]|uniref:uncharacterized protein n=1 Tax=Neoarthrinium moseri TaxID=1658444 RepID=UPI001FDD1504|nr:uncharacterized protein JN550_008322 [Neoarthrinium moseri]KAI1865565.1 hypothetical protein JN550_008322 [Neoarthrinium moseri]
MASEDTHEQITECLMDILDTVTPVKAIRTDVITRVVVDDAGNVLLIPPNTGTIAVEFLAQAQEVTRANTSSEPTSIESNRDDFDDTGSQGSSSTTNSHNQGLQYSLRARTALQIRAGDTDPILYFSEAAISQLPVYQMRGLAHLERTKIVAVDWGCFATGGQLVDTLMLLYTVFRRLKKLILVVPQHNFWGSLKQGVLIQAPGGNRRADDSPYRRSQLTQAQTCNVAFYEEGASDIKSFNVGIRRATVLGDEKALAILPTKTQVLQFGDRLIPWTEIGNRIIRILRSPEFWIFTGISYAMEQLPLEFIPVPPHINLRDILITGTQPEEATRLPRVSRLQRQALRPSRREIYRLEHPAR